MKPGQSLNKTKRAIMITSLFIASVVFIMLIMFGASNLGFIASGFTVKISDLDRDSAYISLSSTSDFSVLQSSIVCKTPDYMKDTTGSLVSDDVDEIEGEHNGKNYIAFTFFVRNTGSNSCNMLEKMNIDGEIKGAASAIRVRIYRDGVVTNYAKLSATGQDETYFCDKSFLSDKVVFENTNENFEVGETVKFTVVIWLEGEDPECLDNIRGGMVKLSMEFSVIGAT